MNSIYLDYAATTPVDDRVLVKMQDCLTAAGAFGNPASEHAYGKAARELIETARAQVAEVLHAEPTEIVFTSGATESNNLAIKGVAQLYQHRGKHIITMTTEHKSVLDPCQHLEKNGFHVTYLAPDENGVLNIDTLNHAIRNDTILVSIMHVNNETGVVQAIENIAKLTAEKGILLHVDAAQSIGKVAVNLSQIPIDLLSLCAHKAYGPKGVGVLYLRKKPRVRVQPLLHGGGHEQGMRSGTLATHQIVGMGEAFVYANEALARDTAHITKLSEMFLQGIKKLKGIHVNGERRFQIPHIVNLRFDGMTANDLLMQLPGIACSTASACQAQGTEGSHVLRAMGLTEMQIKSALRFSFGRYTTLEDIEYALDQITKMYEIIEALAPQARVV